MAPKTETEEDHQGLDRFNLPLSVSGPGDLNRLIRELEFIDNEILQLSLRRSETNQLPKSSRPMDETVKDNQLNLLKSEDRANLKTALIAIRDRAPCLHISLSADPPEPFMERLMSWLRQEINPFLLVTIGLQPNIGAGCVVRSTNKHFDFSLKADFASKRDLLLARLKAAAVPPPPPPPPTIANLEDTGI